MKLKKETFSMLVVVFLVISCTNSPKKKIEEVSSAKKYSNGNYSIPYSGNMEIFEVRFQGDLVTKCIIDNSKPKTGLEIVIVKGAYNSKQEFINDFKAEIDELEEIEVDGKLGYKKIEDNTELFNVYYDGKMIVGVADYNTETDRKILEKIFNSIEIHDQYKSTMKRDKVNFTKQEAKFIIKDIKEKIEILHPDPYKFRTRSETENTYQEIIEKIDTKEQWVRREMKVMVGNFLNGLKDGHTGIDLVEFSTNPIPILVKLRDDKLVISGYDEEREEIDKKIVGKEILSIEGIKTNKIIKDMKNIISFDEGADEFQESVIENNFDSLFKLLYGEKDEGYIVKYEEGEKEETVILNSSRGLKPKMFMKDGNPWKVDYIGNNAGVLTLYAFPGREEGVKAYKKMLKEFFKNVEEKDIENIVLDFRKNLGGYLPMTDYLYDYFDKDNEKHYDGKTYLLTDRNTFSAGVIFSKMAKDNNNITILGRKTGSRVDCFGNPVSYNINGSGIKVDISTLEAFKKLNYTGVVSPDIEIDIDSVQEVLGKDQVMEYVSKILKEEI